MHAGCLFGIFSPESTTVSLHRPSASTKRNESVPSSGVLIALADALDVSVDYLASASDIRLEGVQFRRNRLCSRRDEAQVEANVLHPSLNAISLLRRFYVCPP